MANNKHKKKSWGNFIIDGELQDTGERTRTTSGSNFLKSLAKIPLAVLQQVKENRLAITLSKRPTKDLSLGLGLGPRPTPGPGSPYSPFGTPLPSGEEPEDQDGE